MADNQEELKELFETGTTKRQIEAAKAKNKADYDLLVKQGMNLMRPEEKKKTPSDVLKELGEGGAKAAEDLKIRRGVLQGIKGYSPSKEVQKFDENYKKGGKVKCMKKGGSVSSASKRADGIATKGKTKGRII